MAHESLYNGMSTFDGTLAVTFGVDRRDLRDPQTLGEALIDLRGKRFRKRAFHLVHDWLETLR